jgi:hypothetical protein
MHREAAQRMAWNVCGVGDGRRTRANGCSAGSGAVAATELLALIPEAMIVASKQLQMRDDEPLYFAILLLADRRYIFLLACSIC